MLSTKAFKNPTILKILDYYKNLWALSYTSAIAHWDLETYMPQKGALTRGEALGRVSVIRQKMFLDGGFVGLIHKAESIKNLTAEERGVVRMLLRDLKFYEKVPANFLGEFEKLTNTATVVWREAKQKDDFKLFAKPLTQIFEKNRQLAQYLGYKKSVYDALLDLFEEGLTADRVESFFNTISTPLQDLLNKIVKSPRYFKTHELENTKYDRQKMQELNQKVLDWLWSDRGRFRIDASSHPFTTSFGKNDTRITTWYHDVDFGRSLLAVIHEFGHALYDLQSADLLEMTPVQGGSSLVIHESQSRFWENMVGRSEAFIKKFLPDFRKVTGKADLKFEEVYLYFNKVRPGLLRVEADEVTYHFHIMLRFEIEKAMIEGKLKVKDLPQIWSEKMKSYLGITPKKDSLGVLQDIHWSGGSVGYFPTYSLGTFLGAQWEKEVGKDIKNLDIPRIEGQLKNKIHQFGSVYTLDNLLNKNQMKFNPGVNLDYLYSKYSKIYGF